METVNVVEVYDWVKVCVARTMSAGSVSIVLEPFPQDLCKSIITDKQWLVENLLCLISNAQKFTAQGNIRIKYSAVKSTPRNAMLDKGVRLLSRTTHSFRSEYESEEVSELSKNQSGFWEPHSAPAMVMVEVIDDGIGISEEAQRTLFKPFKQAMRRAGGTGLGIYSLSKRVESLGGTCGVSSRADGVNGARFWFTLPYRPDVTVAASLASSSPKARSSLQPAPFSAAVGSGIIPQSTSEITDFDDDPGKAACTGIMLVEDSHLIQKTCARSFLREGIEVEIANNGLECVEKVYKSPTQYKVLLMDVNMPLMDGLEATTRIRQWERTRSGDEHAGSERVVDDIESNSSVRKKGSEKLLIIGVSANSDSQSKQEALDAGMDRFLSKPLKMSAFRDCLDEFNLDFENFKSRS
jgi:CheY-like chemotaxis protein